MARTPATTPGGLPAAKILMITNNGSFHHTQRVEAFLQSHEEHIDVKWLLAYCPDLNDIERT